MASESKDGKAKTLAEQATSKVIPDEIDLDKNPIKYATHEPGVTTTEPHDKDYMELTLRAGQHSALAQKLLRQRIELRAKEFPRWPGEHVSGVRAIWIESRFWYDRERLGPDFDQDWRSYRARYLKSLELDPREPVHVPEYERDLINPIRRFYMKGGDFIENKIIKLFVPNDKYKSALHRVTCTRLFMSWLLIMGGYYWTYYHRKIWEENYGALLYISRPITYPGAHNWPFKDWKTEPADHETTAFPKRTIYKDLRDFEDTTVVL